MLCSAFITEKKRVGRSDFLCVFYQIFYKHYIEKQIRLLTVCLKMAIQSLGSVQKFRVSRESGNTFIFLGLTKPFGIVTPSGLDYSCLFVPYLYNVFADDMKKPLNTTDKPNSWPHRIPLHTLL